MNRDYEHTLSQVIGASGVNVAGDLNSSPVIQNLKYVGEILYLCIYIYSYVYNFIFWI